MRRRIVWTALLLTGCAFASLPASSHLGTWTLQSTEAFDSSGQSVYAPEVQTGVLILTDTHYALMWTRTPRPAAAMPWNATEAERLARDATLIAHAGRYRLDGDELVMYPETAKSPEFVGGMERFTIEVHGQTMLATATDARSLDGTTVPFYAAGGRQGYVFVRP